MKKKTAKTPPAKPEKEPTKKTGKLVDKPAEPEPEAGGCIVLPTYLAKMMGIPSTDVPLKDGRPLIHAATVKGNADEWQVFVTNGRIAMSVRGRRKEERVAKPYDHVLRNRAQTAEEIACDPKELASVLAAANKFGNHLGVCPTEDGGEYKLITTDGRHANSVDATKPANIEEKLKTLWPTEPPLARMLFNPHLLIKLLQAVVGMLEKGEEKAYLCFYGRKADVDRPVAIVAVTEEQETIDALLMPLTGGKGPFG